MNISNKRKIKRKLRLQTIFFLAITLVSNSFAWFVYTTKVSSSFTTRVREWKVSFDVNGTSVDKLIELNIESIYPGMEDANQNVTITNSGESTARVEFEIVEANILGDNLKDTGMTDTEILSYLKLNYPFSINFDLSSELIVPKSETNASVSITWPYEAGNDEFDTYWGDKAYEHHLNNPDAQSIKLVIKLTAYQAQ